ncbi:DNA-packaging protein [Photorhabdus laumondii subsp. laumondii]|uniref:Photorhabdus luminescens subsp. laumondii TTO1 complete genome segment 8/17 n=2 Tax=Photorhabdus laumondii subsp. laumondii TaxID=141679 RepID=Q7N4M2_PHOLL|nr:MULTISPECIES: phage tail protein [Photorhabdus]AWK42072.1 DNA-packaging protein [Photorhabdus laumondii subsp. laumondii]AXG42937.1 DNA-packaging protein [Photorhabdus laumondii subsp. laumondii]AXG47397.1 DNA-packaging protein [Photorhabdus laumondii subsp. laumondii]KTL63179.1 DNA-packaging protein [Photorhabdus laumondii subsp. laumondii]MCC8384520.1 tail fiber protein [Photorhabdus laumondii]
MSPKNDFKPFSIRNDSNIVSQERYEADKSLQEGFPPDNISTHVLNKTLRQSSTIASVVANFIATQSGDDVLDDGDIDKLTTQLNRALKQIATDGKVPNSRKINGKALTEDINLNASDVGAYTRTEVYTRSEVYTRAEVDRLIKTTSEIPVGAPIPWPLPHPPIGYFTCNGSAFNKLQYPKLAEAYPDGRLPDLRGEFIRGWDDGRGVDAKRVILTSQEDAIQKITGTFTTIRAVVINAAGAFSLGDSTHRGNTLDGGDYGRVVNFDSSLVARAATETRPRNIAFNYIVKAE